MLWAAGRGLSFGRYGHQGHCSHRVATFSYSWHRHPIDAKGLNTSDSPIDHFGFFLDPQQIIWCKPLSHCILAVFLLQFAFDIWPQNNLYGSHDEKYLMGLLTVVKVKEI
jgi:hypothetical protein